MPLVLHTAPRYAVVYCVFNLPGTGSPILLPPRAPPRGHRALVATVRGPAVPEGDLEHAQRVCGRLRRLPRQDLLPRHARRLDRAQQGPGKEG